MYQQCRTCRSIEFKFMQAFLSALSASSTLSQRLFSAECNRSVCYCKGQRGWRFGGKSSTGFCVACNQCDRQMSQRSMSVSAKKSVRDLFDMSFIQSVTRVPKLGRRIDPDRRSLYAAKVAMMTNKASLGRSGLVELWSQMEKMRVRVVPAIR